MPLVPTRAGTLAYHVRGSGPTVVLLPAALHDHHDFDAVSADLARHHRVVAVDCPGCGDSPPAPDPHAVTAPVLADGLRAAGWVVDVVETYRTVPAQVPDAALDEVATSDAVAFASSSAVRNFADAVEHARRPPVAVVIGPITAATASEVGFETVIEAATHDLDGLVSAVRDWSTGLT